MINKAIALINKYNTLSAPVKASMWFVFANVIQKIIGFLCTPIYTRLLSVSEYGYYTVYSSWSDILTIFVTLNLAGGVLFKAFVKYEGSENAFITSMQGLNVVMGIIWIGAAILLYPYLGGYLEMEFDILIMTLFSIMIYPAFSYWAVYQRYQYKYKALVGMNILISVSTAVLNIILIYLLPQKEYALIYSKLIISCFIGFLYWMTNLKKSKCLYDASYWSYALKFNVPLIPHYLSMTILSQADRIMISNMCGQDKAGIYSLSYTVSMVMNMVVSAVNSSFIPWTYKSLKERKYLEINNYSFVILIGMAFITILAVAVAPEIILFLGTREYLEAKWIIAPVMLSIYFTLVYSFFANVEFYYEKSVWVMIASIIAALFNVIFNYMLIPIFGYIAAGYTTLGCYILLAVVHYMFMKKICNINGISSIYNIKQIIAFSLVLIVICMMEMLLYDYLMARILLIVIMCCCMWKKRDAIINTYKKFKEGE